VSVRVLAGLAALHLQKQLQRQKPERHSVGWQGTVGVRGRREPIHGGLVAACSCALSCAHGKTGVGRPAQPARGMPRAHAAHTPQTHSALPSTVGRRLLVGADRWSAHLSDVDFHNEVGFRADQRSTPTTISSGRQQAAEICRRRGGSGGRGVSAMDGATEPPWMDLRRPLPLDPPRPATGTRLLTLLRPLSLIAAGAGLPALPVQTPGRAGRIGVSAVIRSRRCASPSSTCTPPRKPPATPS